MSHEAPQLHDDRSRAGRQLLAMLAMSVPIVINNVSRTIMGFVDFAMVSQLGTTAQAAITPAVLLMYCVLGIGMGTAIAVNTFSSQSLGRGRAHDAAGYAWQGVILGALFGLMTLPLVAAAPWGIRLFGHAADVQALETRYMKWALLSAGPSMIAYALTQFFIGVHRPWIGCTATISANLFNILANWLLIFGHWGFPRLGISGAALGTVCATSLQCLVLLGFYWSPPFRRAFATHQSLGWSWAKASGVLRVGLPTGAHFGLDILSWTVFVGLVVGRRFGTEQLAATNIIFQYLHLSFMPAVGIGVALCAMTGKAIGRRDLDLAIRQTYTATAICMSYMGLCGLVFFLARVPLVELFNSEPAVVAIGAKLFICAAVFQIFDGLGIAAMNALRGAGDTFWPSVYNAVLIWSILIGGGLAVGRLWPNGGALGPWIMATTYIILIGLTFWGRFARGSWRKIDIFAGAEPRLASMTAAAWSGSDRDLVPSEAVARSPVVSEE